MPEFYCGRRAAGIGKFGSGGLALWRSVFRVSSIRIAISLEDQRRGEREVAFVEKPSLHGIDARCVLVALFGFHCGLSSVKKGIEICDLIAALRGWLGIFQRAGANFFTTAVHDG